MISLVDNLGKKEKAFPVETHDDLRRLFFFISLSLDILGLRSLKSYKSVIGK